MSPVRALIWVALLVFAFIVAGWVAPVALLIVGGMFRPMRPVRATRRRRR